MEEGADAKPIGRPSSFSQEIADEICELVATTPRGLDFICSSDDKLPCARTVHSWLSAQPAFLQSYLRARERQADLIFDECLEIADDHSRDTKLVGTKGDEREVADTEWISRSKLRVDTRMRMAGKLHPKKYGDKLQTEISDPQGNNPFAPLMEMIAATGRPRPGS